ncbi:MAG TPA: hypothetical protein VFC53_03740 [Dehalococcoidia bacterium]|jgi:hypothetical protein|nr:hypothetical protein [Dehalococcoidia bacterium]
MPEDDETRRHHDLIDQAKLRRKRSERPIGEPAERVERRRRQHEWQHIALGRVCVICGLAQREGEYDDSPACGPRAS